MNNQTVIDFMIIMQVVSFFMIYFERHYIKENWNKIPKRALCGRIFMVFLPLLVIISLIYKPL